MYMCSDELAKFSVTGYKTCVHAPSGKDSSGEGMMRSLAGGSCPNPG